MNEDGKKWDRGKWSKNKVIRQHLFQYFKETKDKHVLRIASCVQALPDEAGGSFTTPKKTLFN